jgi:hypothetical protein
MWLQTWKIYGENRGRNLPNQLLKTTVACPAAKKGKLRETHVTTAHKEG